MEDRFMAALMVVGFLAVIGALFSSYKAITLSETEQAAPWHRCPDQDVMNMHAWCNGQGSMVLPQAGTTLSVDGQLLK